MHFLWELDYHSLISFFCQIFFHDLKCKSFSLHNIALCQPPHKYVVVCIHMRPVKFY